jgi:PKD repeat protein
MRSIRLLAALTGTLLLGSACGDGGGGTPPPENEAPVANFTVPVGGCTVNTTCTFIDASTDDVAVTTWRWDFTGDGTPDAITQDAAHSYAAAGTFTVVLTVTDGEGLTNTKTATVVVAPVAPPANVPPTAGFTSSCTATNCNFTNSSTDTDGTITYLWNFGEPASGANNESTLEDPTHGYTVTAPTTFTVTLTVTDDDGATDVETQTVSVTPTAPGAQDCSTVGLDVDCVLGITARATIKITLTSVACDLDAQRISIPPPITKHVFGNLCNKLPPLEYVINDPTGAPMVFAAGTQLPVRFTQGTGTPTPGAPAGKVEGTYPNWTLKFDDGGNAGGAGEPDFTDVVLTVQATAAP